MDPIATLMNEHRTIERVLDALDAWTARVVAERVDDRPGLARYARFLREFADARHHGKEEDLLFAAMVEHGFSRAHGPLAVMLHEHGLGRALTATLGQLAAQLGPWTDGDRAELERAVGGYGELLRQHIDKEDQVLYPMAQARLPAAVMAGLAQRFVAVDPPGPDALDALAAALADGP